MADNREFCEQIGAAIVTLGTQEALSCMARMMCAIAQNQGVDLKFECDLGAVEVNTKQLTLQS